MTTIPKGPRESRWFAVFLTAALAVAAAPQAYAFNSILNNFNSTYPASATGANADCAVCHLSTGGTGGGLNEYGFQLQAANRNFAAIEGLPSANINGGTTMLDEINASTQPGWTTGANNNTYDFNGNLLASNATAPAGIAGDLDPGAANNPPVANDDSATTNQDTAVTINVVANDTDVNGDLDPTSVAIEIGRA